MNDLVARLRAALPDEHHLGQPDSAQTHPLILEAADTLEELRSGYDLQYHSLALYQAGLAAAEARAEKAERALREIRDIPFASGAVGLIASPEAVRRMLLTASRALGSADPDFGKHE